MGRPIELVPEHIKVKGFSLVIDRGNDNFSGTDGNKVDLRAGLAIGIDGGNSIILPHSSTVKSRSVIIDRIDINLWGGSR